MNWSENFRFAARSVRTPTRVEELQEIVAAAKRAKAIGTRHSFNRVADSAGVLIDTSELDLALAVDHDAMTATVPGGWTYSRVVDELEAAGVALENLASLPHISLAGGTATGTHGSGDTNKVLAASIVALEMVTAEGSLQRFDRNDPVFGAVAMGLGVFGVITTMTLAVQPSYLVRQDFYRDTTWPLVLDNLDEVFASAYSVNMHVGFSEPNVRVLWCKHRVGSNTAPPPDTFFGATRVLENDRDPGRVTLLNEPGPWAYRLAHFLPQGAPSVGGDELQSSYFVDRADGVDAINALRSIGDRIDPHLHGSEIRTVAADDLWLSPATGRDTLSIGFTWKKHLPEVEALLPDVEAALAPFAARPHWGKLFAMGRPQLLEVFDKLDPFLEAAGHLDPDSTFTSPVLEQLRGS